MPDVRLADMLCGHGVGLMLIQAEKQTPCTGARRAYQCVSSSVTRPRSGVCRYLSNTSSICVLRVASPPRRQAAVAALAYMHERF